MVVQAYVRKYVYLERYERFHPTKRVERNVLCVGKNPRHVKVG